MGLFKEYEEDLLAKDEQLLADIEEGKPYKSVDRIIDSAERAKRGCAHCIYSQYVSKQKMANRVTVLEKNERMLVCAFRHCPLHELDKYRDYREYLRENEGKVEKALSKALKTKVEALKENELDEEPPKPIDKQTRWLIGVRRSQGFTVEQMQREFRLKKEQIIKEIKKYDKKHSYV